MPDPTPFSLVRTMTKTSFDIAVIGATGITGEALLDQLITRDFPVGSLYVLGDEDTVGERVPYGDGSLRVVAAAGFEFPKAQLVFAADETVDPDLIRQALGAGCHVIDVTGRSSFGTDLPPLVAGVNEHAIAACATQRFYRNPSCTSILLWKVLKPVYDLCGIERIDVTVLQAVSERGRQGIEELAGQTARLLNVQPIESGIFPGQIAFNVLGDTGIEAESGFSPQELQIMAEAKQLLADDSVIVNPTFLTVPVFYGDTLVCTLWTLDPCDAETIVRQWSDVEGVKFLPASADNCPAPVNMAGSAEIHVTRLGPDPVDPRGLKVCLVADCSRAGLARNSVQIAEILVKGYL